MKVISSIKIGEDRQKMLLSVQPDVQIVQVKDFSAGDDDAEVMLTYGWDVKAETLGKFPRLSWIQTLSAGVDMLPLDTIAKRDIILTNVRGAHKIQMAEHIIWSILMLLRQGKTFVRQQDSKVFDAKPKVEEMFGKTVCIVGAGTIGKEIAQRCSAFGMKVYGISRTGRQDPAFEKVAATEQMSEILAISDIVVVVLPLTPHTRNFVDASFIEMMKEGSFLVNAARGPVTDEEQLLHALQKGKIAAAALDVFIREPLPENSPFWELENVFITPHIGGRSVRAAERMWSVFAQNLSKYPDRKKLANIIDLENCY